MNLRDHKDVVILGGGIAGCACSDLLTKSGYSVTIAEKGRGVGGRMSTRRMSGARIDHGAQFLTMRDERTRGLFNELMTAGIMEKWYDQNSVSKEIPEGIRYMGIGGMSSIPKFLSRGSYLETKFFVKKVKWDGVWSVEEAGEQKRILTADELVITFPPPQILELQARNSFILDQNILDQLGRVHYTKTLAVLCLLEKPTRLDAPGILTHPNADIDWIADNQIKDISENPSVIIHSSHEYAEKYWDAEDEVRIPSLTEVTQDLLGAKIQEFSCHRWGFAKPLVTFGENHFSDDQTKLTLAGDGFGGERIENAMCSGLDAAKSIINRR